MARVAAGPALAALSAKGPGLARAFETVAADLAALRHAVDAIAARARAGFPRLNFLPERPAQPPESGGRGRMTRHRA